MTLVVLTFLAIMAIGFPQTSPVHPRALTLQAESVNETLDCQPNQDEAPSLDRPVVGRAANFSALGSYHCRRWVFSSSERNPWIERVLAAETLKAKTLAAEIAARKGELKGPLGVSVHGEADPALLSRVAAIYRIELAGVLGPHGVRHFEQVPPEIPYLDIAIRRVDAPDLLSAPRFHLAKGEP